MYADRLRSRRIDPVALSGASVIGGAIIMALINIAPNLVPTRLPDPPFITTNIPINQAPPPKPQPQPKTEKKVAQRPDEKVIATDPLIKTEPAKPDIETIKEVSLDPPTKPEIGKAETVAEPPPPAMIGAEVDPRYADDFQPPYPATELRAELEGVITVRVQIGADGRVKAIEPVGKPNTGFFEATRRQAFARWRFKPATRGGVAVDSWKTMTVRFEIES